MSNPSRRRFLQLSGLALGAAATGDLSALAGKALSAASTVSPEKAALIMDLLEKREELIIGSGEGLSISDNIQGFTDTVEAINSKYLEPLGYDSSLLTPKEAQAMSGELRAAREAFGTEHVRLTREITQVDNALKPHTADLDKMLEPSRFNQELLEKASSATGADKTKLVEQMVDTPFDRIDTNIVDDAMQLADGERSQLMTEQFHDTQQAMTDYQETVRDVGRFTKEEGRSEDWVAKRREKLMEHAKTQLDYLATHKQVKISSTMDRGPGPDVWRVDSYTRPDEDGRYQDQTLSSTMNELEMTLNRLAEMREGGKNTDFHVKHDRPQAPGYGVHETERLSVEAPEFAVRVMLREAADKNLKLQNKQNGIKTAATRK